MSERAAIYWNSRYGSPDGVTHHSRQNRLISVDFLDVLDRREGIDGLSFQMRRLLSGNVIEIGCGTGELAAEIADRYLPRLMFATDFSENAVRQARDLHPGVRFEKFDILNHWPTLLGGFDVAISSNTLEHFRDPHLVIDRMLTLAPRAILLVPYRQPVTDSYETEGGAGHAVTFTLKTFKPYRVLDHFTFVTHGWQHRAKRETPRQLAILLARKRGA